MIIAHFLHLFRHFKDTAMCVADKLNLRRAITHRIKQSSQKQLVTLSSMKDSQKVLEYQVLKGYVEAYSKDSPPRLLAFGDSVYLRAATDDQAPQPLAEILGAYYKNSMCLVSGSGYHLGMFEKFSEVLATLRTRPRIAILPINLRSFSPTWDLNPLYQFYSEIELLSSFDFKRPDYRLHDTKPSLESEGRLVPLELDGEETITLGDFLDILGESPAIDSEAWKDRLKTIFQYHYMYSMYSEHRKLKSLKQIIRLLNEHGVAVYCYITPINYEAGIEYCGDIFINVVKKNISIIQREVKYTLSAVSTDNDTFMFRFDDFAFRFTRNVFFTLHNATEHLRFEGRDFIAQQIVEAERALIKNGAVSYE